MRHHVFYGLAVKYLHTVTQEKSYDLGSVDELGGGGTHGSCQKYKDLTLRNVAFQQIRFN
jgi:hypothetical protein